MPLIINKHNEMSIFQSILKYPNYKFEIAKRKSKIARANFKYKDPDL